ncbi:MAG TPA: hypothetical protein VGL94_13000 [Ktedonobacteraceae bacterium]|jgi:hypothetical protein
MRDNEFNRPVSTDSTPDGKSCEWCDRLAEQQLTAIGGTHHNESGFFCHPCGEQFTQSVQKSSDTSLQCI